MEAEGLTDAYTTPTFGLQASARQSQCRVPQEEETGVSRPTNSKIEHAGLPARFWGKTRIEDRGHTTPCVVWTGSGDSQGHGKFWLNGRLRMAQRVAYEALVGPIADHAVIDHLCGVPQCVAVDHLAAVGAPVQRAGLIDHAGLPARFWAKTRIEDRGYGTPCVVWTGGLTDHGYGQCYTAGRRIRGAHRIAYEALVASVPDALHIDHLCRNRACVAVDHLEPVTPRENTIRGKRLITECPYGHPYDDANTCYINGGRACRTCRNERERARRARKKAERNMQQGQ